MRMVAVAGALVIALASSASSQQGPQNERADATTSSGIAYRLAVDRRRPPQRAAAHATEGEVWAIVDGNGEITTGGTIVEIKKGDTVERRIHGGTVHKVSKGNFLLIPEGVPNRSQPSAPSCVW